VDSRGSWCPPIPITDLFKAWRGADLGEEDVKAWAKKSGNKVVEVRREEDVTHIVVRVLRKGKEVAIAPAAKGNFNDPDETKITPKAKLQLLIVNGFAMGLRTLEPGWRWSTDMQPLAKTASCQIRHVGYVVSGRMGFLMDDGTELEVGPGEVFDVRPGHDTWTIGDSPAVFVDIIGTVEH
jgi:TusA-related sulfurtransferase